MWLRSCYHESCHLWSMAGNDPCSSIMGTCDRSNSGIGMAISKTCRRTDGRFSGCHTTNHRVGSALHGGRMTHIWICRHPPTQSNGLCIGQSPVPISIAWDEAVEKVLESTPITPTEIWTSDLPRCHTLATLCAQSWNLTVQVDRNLREISMGEWQGKSYDDLQALDTKRWEEWCSDWQHVIPPNGENLAM